MAPPPVSLTGGSGSLWLYGEALRVLWSDPVVVAPPGSEPCPGVREGPLASAWEVWVEVLQPALHLPAEPLCKVQEFFIVGEPEPAFGMRRTRGLHLL
jgi:hypothetical protein